MLYLIDSGATSNLQETNALVNLNVTSIRKRKKNFVPKRKKNKLASLAVDEIWQQNIFKKKTATKKEFHEQHNAFDI